MYTVLLIKSLLQSKFNALKWRIINGDCCVPLLPKPKPPPTPYPVRWRMPCDRADVGVVGRR